MNLPFARPAARFGHRAGRKIKRVLGLETASDAKDKPAQVAAPASASPAASPPASAGPAAGPPPDAVRPNRDFAQFFRHVKKLGFDPGTCIDVGAADGTGAIYEAFPRAKHIVFEPLPSFHEALEKRLARFDYEIHHCALMEEKGRLEILLTDNLYSSSMMHQRAAGDGKLLEVAVERLDDVLDAESLAGPVLLKTDCQGADLLVVKGGLKVLAVCDIVILETSLFKFWGDHHPDFAEIVAYMADHDFVVYDILDGLFRPSDRALGQVDLVFAKRSGFLRASRKW